jgi:hypothetical protein
MQTCGIVEKVQCYDVWLNRNSALSSLFLRMLLLTPRKRRDTTLLHPTYVEGWDGKGLNYGGSEVSCSITWGGCMSFMLWCVVRGPSERSFDTLITCTALPLVLKDITVFLSCHKCIVTAFSHATFVTNYADKLKSPFSVLNMFSGKYITYSSFIFILNTSVSWWNIERCVLDITVSYRKKKNLFESRTVALGD